VNVTGQQTFEERGTNITTLVRRESINVKCSYAHDSSEGEREHDAERSGLQLAHVTNKK